MSLGDLAEEIKNPSVAQLMAAYPTMDALNRAIKMGKVPRTTEVGIVAETYNRIINDAMAKQAQMSSPTVLDERLAMGAPPQAAGLPAVPVREEMFQGMAGGGIVAMAGGGDVPRYQAGGGDVPRYQNRGLVMGYPGFEEEVGLSSSDLGGRGAPRSLRNRYEEFYNLQKEFGGEDEEAKLYREALLKRQAALEGRRGDAANMALLQLGLGMLGTKSPYFFEAAGQSGKEALGQYQASKARQEAEELEVAKGLAGLAGRSRAEKLAALGKAYEAQTAEEREAARLAGQKDIAQIQATRGTNMSIFVDNAVDNARAQARAKGGELSPSEEAQIRAAAGERYIELSAALGPRGVSAQAAADQAAAAGAREERTPLTVARQEWNDLKLTDPNKHRYNQAMTEARRLETTDKNAAAAKRAEAESIKDRWIEKEASRSPSGGLPANPNDPLGLRTPK
jgi:hypothetical protein